MNNFQKKLAELMKDRNGTDQFSVSLAFTGLILIIISSAILEPFITSILTIIACFSLVLSVVRIFSKDIEKRKKENDKFLSIFSKNKKSSSTKKQTISKNQKMKEKLKTHEMFYCPKCKSPCFVPKNKGKVRITCPKCGEKFIGET